MWLPDLTLVDALGRQDCLCGLLVRGPEAARPEVISTLSAVHPAQDLEALRGYLADPTVVIVTITVTEAGYFRSESGVLDVDAAPVKVDVQALQADSTAGVVRDTGQAGRRTVRPPSRRRRVDDDRAQRQRP